MSRFFDQLATSKAVPWPELEKLLGQATVILADNVAEYFYAGSDQDYWSLETDFPNLAPPFEVVFIEWRDPAYVLASGIGRRRIGIRRRNGALFSCAEFAATHGDGDAVSCRWVEHICLWTESDRGIDLLALMTIKVGADGRPVRFSEQGYFRAMINPDLATPPPAEVLLSLVQPAFLTVCFLHCKNVHMQTHSPPVPLARKHRLRYGRAPVVYKTLVIEPMKRVLKDEGRSETDGVRRALHVCRGHFKDYRARGLFGRLHGVFWWPDHLAGTFRSGLVKKDYDVRPPSDDPRKP